MLFPERVLLAHDGIVTKMGIRCSMKALEDNVIERIDADEVLDLLVALVNTPSAATEYPEEDCARIVADKLHESGATATLCEVEPRRPNVLAELGDPDGRSLLLSGHLDTVKAYFFSS